MSDQPRASKLARAAFDLWQAGRLEEASVHYEQALALADPQHYGLPDYHGEFACVLSALGRNDEARAHLESAVSVQLNLDPSNLASGVVIARYFLAEHHIEQRRPAEALAAIAPSLTDDAEGGWIMRLAQAKALHALERFEDAVHAAHHALKLAPSDKKRDELTQHFQSFGIGVGERAG